MPFVKPPPGGPVDWSHPLAAGLVGAWAFLEGSGPVQDLTGGPAGTPTGGAAWGPGDSGPAVTTDGTTGYVAVGVSPRPALTAISVAVRERYLAIPLGFDGLAGQTNGTGWTQGWGFFHTSDGAASFFIEKFDGTGTGTGGRVVTAGGVPTTNWATHVGTWDGATVTYWIDAVNKGSGSYAGSFTQASNPIEFGRLGSNTYNVNAAFDYVLIWNRALTEAEIRTLQADPLAFLARPRTGARWKFASAGGGPQSATLPTASVAVAAASPAGAGTGGASATLPLATVAVAAVSPTASAGGVAAGLPTATAAVAAVSPAGAGTGGASATLPLAAAAVAAVSPTASAGGVAAGLPTATAAVAAVSPAGAGTGGASATLPLAAAAVAAVSPTASAGGVAAGLPTATAAVAAVSPAGAGTGGASATLPLAAVVVAAASPAGVASGVASRALPAAAVVVTAVPPAGLLLGAYRPGPDPARGTAARVGPDPHRAGAAKTGPDPARGTAARVTR